MSLPAGTLERLWLGDLTDEERVTVEEHIFDCDACAAEFSRLAAIAAGTRRLEGIRRLPAALTRAELDALVDYRVAETEIRAGVRNVARYPKGLDVLVLRLVVGASQRRDRYALEILAGAQTLASIGDVPDAGGELLLACRSHFLDDFPLDLTFRLRAQDGTVLADYEVDHRRVE